MDRAVSYFCHQGRPPRWRGMVALLPLLRGRQTNPERRRRSRQALTDRVGVPEQMIDHLERSDQRAATRPSLLNA